MSMMLKPRLLVTGLVLSMLLAAFLLTAITFEFYMEEMAKIFVVPILVIATVTSFGLIIILARSSTS